MKPWPQYEGILVPVPLCQVSALRFAFKTGATNLLYRPEEKKLFKALKLN